MPVQVIPSGPTASAAPTVASARQRVGFWNVIVYLLISVWVNWQAHAELCHQVEACLQNEDSIIRFFSFLPFVQNRQTKAHISLVKLWWNTYLISPSNGCSVYIGSWQWHRWWGWLNRSVFLFSFGLSYLLYNNSWILIAVVLWLIMVDTVRV